MVGSSAVVAAVLDLPVFLYDSAREVPERPAVIRGDTVLTYGQVDALANQLANALVAR